MSGIVGSYFNTRGSGVVAKLGTDGQVFTSTGAGLSQGFEAAAAGGAWTFIKSITASGAGDVQFVNGTSDVVFDSTYIAYKIYGFNISTDNDDDILRGTYSDDTGTSYETSNYDCKCGSVITSSVTRFDDSASAFYINALGTAAEENLVFNWIIYNPADDSSFTWSNYDGIFRNMSGGNVYTAFAGSVYKQTDDIDAVKFEFADGNITGLFKLYGLSPS